MDLVAAMIVFLLICLCLFLLLSLLWFLYKFWWTPVYIQRFMKSQGIKGPSYKFLHGNTEQIMNMRKESISSPMDYISHDICPRLHPHIYSWVKQYGNILLNWHGPSPQLIVTEPDLIKEILSNKDGVFPKRNPDIFGKKLIGDGLVATNDTEKWSTVRKIANHAFHAESLKGMIPAMIASVEGMLERWKYHEGKEVEVCEEFRLMTSEVISRTAFGSSYLEGEIIFGMLMKLGQIVSRNTLKIRFPGIGKLFKSNDDIESDKIEQAIHESILNIIKEREKKMMTGEADSFGSDFLGSLIKANHGSGDNMRISVQDVIAECKTFYFAGQETTSSLLTWTILLLAIHTDWQEKARKEVVELFGNKNPNSDGITRLKIVNMIVNESLRIYSPIVNLSRTVKRKVRLGKFVIPANVQFLIPPLMLHHNPEIWGQDSHLFKPERFAKGVSKATNNNPMAFLPFGFGPRACVGLNFASTEAKIALSMILQHYKFTLSPTYVHAPIQALMIRPQHGIPILLQEIVN